VAEPDNLIDLDISPDLAAEACHDALERLAALLAREQSTDLLVAEVAAIITEWAEALEADDMRERLAEMLDQLEDAIALAEDESSEIEEDDTDGRRLNEQKLVGLQAMYDAFARAADAMP
jgi:uncharacterized protein (DUF3084 family)